MHTLACKSGKWRLLWHLLPEVIASWCFSSVYVTDGSLSAKQLKMILVSVITFFNTSLEWFMVVQPDSKTDSKIDSLARKWLLHTEEVY